MRSINSSSTDDTDEVSKQTKNGSCMNGLNGDSKGTSRRNLLKCIGASTLAAATIPGITSASPNYSFIASLDFPMNFKKESSNEYALVDDSDITGVTVAGQFSVDALAVPSKEMGIGCNWWGSSCDEWRSLIPVTISWNTDAPSRSVGDISLGVNVEPIRGGEPYDGRGPHIPTSDDEHLVDESDDRYISIDFDTDQIPSSQYYMPAEVTFSVDFNNSSIHDGRLSESVRIGIPNNDVIQQTANMIGTADTVWSESVGLADTLVRAPLEDLETATRAWAYASSAATGMIDSDDLAANAVVDGISAFEEPLNDRTTLEISGEEVYVSSGGPTIVSTHDRRNRHIR